MFKKTWLFILFLYMNAALAEVDNPFGAHVFILDASMPPSSINATIDNIYELQRFNQFGTNRFAVIFLPGSYGLLENIDVKLGYYTQVLGVGHSPNDVVIIGAVRTQDAPAWDAAHPEQGPGSWYNYWRGAENLSIISTLGSLTSPSIPVQQNVWAAGKGSYLRRIHLINSALRLYDLGYATGSFIANSLIDLAIYSGEEKLAFIRNSKFIDWQGNNFNVLFSGIEGFNPKETWPKPPFTVIDKTIKIREKPYLVYEPAEHRFSLNIPPLQKDSKGFSWTTEGRTIPIEQCFIAQPGVSAALINANMQSYHCLIFTPGIYYLDEAIHIQRADTTIYGLGFPSLIPTAGNAALIIDNVGGIILAGIIFDAGPFLSPTLLQVGIANAPMMHGDNPSFLYDINCRVGGMQTILGQTESCMQINDNDVIADNLWIWRADQGVNIGWFANTAKNGLIVQGTNVTAHNLTVDHFQTFQTIWNGENGRVLQFSSELPLDMPHQDIWRHQNDEGFAAYKISNRINIHTGMSLSIFSNFIWTDNIYLQSAVETPLGNDIDLQHIRTFWMGGYENTGIRHVVNELGNETNAHNREEQLANWPQD